MTRNERQLTPFVVMTSRIPYDLYERLADYKMDHRGVSMASIIRDALTEWLGKQDASTRQGAGLE